MLPVAVQVRQRQDVTHSVREWLAQTGNARPRSEAKIVAFTEAAGVAPNSLLRPCFAMASAISV